uniref:Calponin-homology (CH) domain-containing protein n=1 Tax=Macrostomum lignano TaxID=282301 RepID=A0A1I8HYT9_9PLAT
MRSGGAWTPPFLAFSTASVDGASSDITKDGVTGVHEVTDYRQETKKWLSDGFRNKKWLSDGFRNKKWLSDGFRNKKWLSDGFRNKKWLSDGFKNKKWLSDGFRNKKWLSDGFRNKKWLSDGFRNKKWLSDGFKNKKWLSDGFRNKKWLSDGFRKTKWHSDGFRNKKNKKWLSDGFRNKKWLSDGFRNKKWLSDGFRNKKWLSDGFRNKKWLSDGFRNKKWLSDGFRNKKWLFRNKKWLSDGFRNKKWLSDGFRNKKWLSDGFRNKKWLSDGFRNKKWLSDGFRNKKWLSDGFRNKKWLSDGLTRSGSPTASGTRSGSHGFQESDSAYLDSKTYSPNLDLAAAAMNGSTAGDTIAMTWPVDSLWLSMCLDTYLPQCVSRQARQSQFSLPSEQTARASTPRPSAMRVTRRNSKPPTAPPEAAAAAVEEASMKSVTDVAAAETSKLSSSRASWSTEMLTLSLNIGHQLLGQLQGRQAQQRSHTMARGLANRRQIVAALQRQHDPPTSQAAQQRVANCCVEASGDQDQVGIERLSNWQHNVVESGQVLGVPDSALLVAWLEFKEFSGDLRCDISGINMSPVEPCIRRHFQYGLKAVRQFSKVSLKLSDGSPRASSRGQASPNSVLTVMATPSLREERQ